MSDGWAKMSDGWAKMSDGWANALPCPPLATPMIKYACESLASYMHASLQKFVIRLISL